MDRNIKYEIVCTRNFLDVGLMSASFDGKPTCILARPFQGKEREYGIGNCRWYRTGKYITRYEWNKTTEELTNPQIVTYYRLTNKVEFEDELKPKKTNADRIRSMTDEELAERILCPYGACIYRERVCPECVLDWLKSEVEVCE